MGAALHTQALMSALRRTQSGVFTIEKSVSFEEICERENDLAWLESKVIPTEDVLPFKTLVLTAKNKDKIFDGVAIDTEEEDGVYKYYKADGAFYGLATVKDKKARLTTKLC